jgi:GDP-4-dehydro-6-deoxy-D-mannose reductase
MKKVLITGVNGFCGQHLARRLNKEGVRLVYGTDISSEPGTALGLTDYYQLDIKNESQVQKIFKAIKPDFIFNLAGLNKGSPNEIYAVNVIGSINILENLRKFSPKARLLFVGSAAEYGKVSENKMPITEEQVCTPYSTYGISKYISSMIALDYANSYGLKINVVRPFNIIGAGMPSTLVIGAILERVKEAIQANWQEPDIKVGNLETKRDFIAVEDVVDAYIKIVESDYKGEIFNICSGEPRSVGSILKTILANSEKSIRLKIAPELIRSEDVLVSYGSFEKASKALGLTPQKSLDDALRDAWCYAMERN